MTPQSSVRSSPAGYQSGEIWRPIPGQEGRYEVSTLGRVHSLPRPGTRGGLLSTWDVDGYRFVGLMVDGRQEHVGVHRLVLLAHVGPARPGDQARHLNGRRDDNRLSNLTWGTASENQCDTVAYGGNRASSRTHCPANHPYDDENTRLVIGQNGRTHRRCIACDRARKRKR